MLKVVIFILIGLVVTAAQAQMPQAPACEDQLREKRFQAGGLEQQLALEEVRHIQTKKALEVATKRVTELEAKYEKKDEKKK